MSLEEELLKKVRDYALNIWNEIPQGRIVPTSESQSLTHGNTGIRLDATVMYADLKGSTLMVDTLSDTRAAEYYKAYLECGAKIIKNNNGVITAYDGDRIMSVFVGESQTIDAVQSALQINWAVDQIINPIFEDIYSKEHCKLEHTIGIDRSEILATKAGVRIDDDVVWIGPAANYAAKLNSFDGLDPDYQIRITEQAMRDLGINYFSYFKSEISIWDGPYTNLQRGKHYRTNCRLRIA